MVPHENTQDMGLAAHGQRPEWLRPKDMARLFGIGRTKTYELIANRKIKSVSLRMPSQRHGTRLISYDSVVEYLESLVEGGDV